MNSGFQWHLTNTVGNNVAAMTVNDTIDRRKPPVDLAVDESLDISRFRILLHLARIVDVVFNQFIWCTD